MSEADAMQALEAGQISAQVLAEQILGDRDRLLSEIYKRDRKIAELEHCLKLSAQMVECLTDHRSQEASR